MGRLFGALVSKAGIPVPTEITQKVLTAAMHIGSGVTHVPGFELPKVETLLWGQTVSGTVERYFIKGVLTTVWMQLDLWCKFVKMPRSQKQLFFISTQKHKQGV